MRVAGSGTASAGAGSGNEGNKATKNGGMIRDSFPGINSPGQAPVEHARGFSGSRTRLQCSTHQASDQASVVWVGVVCSSPGPRPTFSENTEILEPVPKFWESPAGNSGNFASSDGIVRGCTNHDPRRGGISVT